MYTQTLATVQAEAGHHVAVFCPSTMREDGRAITADAEQDVRIYRIPLGSRTRTQVFRDTFRQKQLQAALQTILRQELPDIVHVQHLMGMPMGLVDLLVDANIPYVVTLHDYWYACVNAQLLTNTDQTICEGPDSLAINCGQCAVARTGREGAMWLAPAISPLMQYRKARLRTVLEKARYVIAPTNFVRQTYINLRVQSDNMVVIRHGIDLPDEAYWATRSKHTLPNGDRPLLVGYVGSIGWQKGVHVLIEAVNELPPGSVQVTIYGDLTTFPEYAAQLLEMIQLPDIKLAGPVSREHFWMAVAELDVVILPTLWFETSSLVLDEAFAAGIPVVASQIGVLNEKVEDGINGRLFSVGDAIALRDILVDILEDPGLLDRWRAGIPAVRTVDEHVREIEELYQSTLDTV